MSLRNLSFVALLTLPLAFASVACGSTDTMDNGTDTSADELGRTKYHYEPAVEDVHFAGGCGIVTNPPQKDCSFGFVLRYTPNYADLKTTITHTTDNTKHTVHITVDTWSYNTIHPMIAVGPENDDLGLLTADVGEKYTVTVTDRHDHVLWTGKVQTLYHL